MKKIVISLLLLVVMVISGCTDTKEVNETKKNKKETTIEVEVETKEDKETVEGYWMSEYGETISFDSNGQAISDGMTMSYSIYGENYLSISSWGTATEYRYSVNDDVLTLVELKNNIKSIYYRNIQKQNEIQKNLEEAQKEKERQEQIAEEKRFYEQSINELRSKITEIDNEIYNKNIKLDAAKRQVLNSEKSVQECRTRKEELERTISELENSNKQGEVGYYKEELKECSAFLNDHEYALNFFNTRVSDCNVEIAKLEAEKEEISKEIEALQEILRNIK